MTAAITAAKPTTLQRIDDLLRKQVFFIVTTWVERLLNGHADVRCHGEAYFGPVLMPLLQQAVQGYNQRQKAGDAGLFTNDDLRELLRTAVGLSFLRWVGDGPVQAIGEKTPEHALCMDPLSQCFPIAKFIHITRDGRDVCVSGWFHNLRKAGPDFKQRFPDLNAYIRYTVGQHWLPYIQHARQFGEQRPEQYHELRYEDLHGDPVGQTRALLGFLGVDDGDEATEACLEAGSFQKLTEGRSRGEEDKASFFRKGVIGDWRNHFDESNTATYNEVAGDLPGQLGYE
jgi:hypothetical protein